MRFLPRSLFGQIVLALVAGILVAQLAGTWLLLDDRSRFGDRLRREYAAQRIAGIISVLDAAPAEERPRLVRALSVPPTRLTLDEPWQASGAELGPEASVFLQRVSRELERPLPLQVLSIRHVPRAERRPGRDMERQDRHMRHDGPLVLLAVTQARLGDGTVVTFRHALPQPPSDWPLRLLGLLALLAIVVALLSGWAVRRLTRPLASLANAADGLARNLDQKPLDEKGPQEVARAARSFNAMQRSLKAYLETRAQALAGVSHDLRLPLTRLRLRLEQLPENDARAAMQRDIEEMDAMVGGTLDYLRAGADTEQAVKLNLVALLEGLAEDAEAAGAKVSLHGTAAPLTARPQALRRCLANLIDNARRYGGGAVDVTLVDNASSVEIRIEDRGAGIPAEERERVFEPYVRLEASRARHTGGTGLGLAIARAVARAHGGEVALAGRAGGGTAAVVTLPRR
ncbi:two-component system, OmpR family, osmolarity sensor histidine kinase EnvZ [Rhodocyclaceae bacterium]|nr:two-component system, OmpR family, osmolarity sensor histidine kinase EnvZ [Rhodocyclaceae bacterium]